jgi:hypothetical protein
MTGMCYIGRGGAASDALHVATALADVLDEVEVFVGFPDADDGGATPCSRQSTRF